MPLSFWWSYVDKGDIFVRRELIIHMMAEFFPLLAEKEV